MTDMLLNIANYLIYQGIVQADGEDIFRDYIPDSPDQVVALQEYAGDGSLPQAQGAQRRFQVAVRASREDPDWARRKAWSIYNVLDVPEGIIDARGVGLQLWGVMNAIQTPFKLRVDDNARILYGFNMVIITERD